MVGFSIAQRGFHRTNSVFGVWAVMFGDALASQPAAYLVGADRTGGGSGGGAGAAAGASPGLAFFVTLVSSKVPIVCTITSALLISFLKDSGSKMLPLSHWIEVFSGSFQNM